MTPGQLVKAVAIALDVPEETVIQHDRNLAVAGLRTKGGRGPSAPEVTPLDAARLFVAVLASVRTKDSVDTVRHFEQVVFSPTPGKLAEGMDVAIKNLPVGHNFIEALAAVIADASRPIDDLGLFLDRFSNVGVSCKSLRSGYIGGIRGLADYFYARDEKAASLTREEMKESEYCRSGIHQDRRVFGTAIMLLGSAFRENGPRFANAREAYLAGYGTLKPAKKPKMAVA